MNRCPICQSEKTKHNLCKVSFTYNTEYDLSECPECHVIYFNPLPSIDQLVTFYSIAGYEYNRWKQERKAKGYIKQLNKKQKSGKFLDIGCATGYMINKINQDSGWDVYGVELSKHPAEFARNVLKLKNIVHGDLFDAAFENEYFDWINISDVLEHVPNPVQVLTECHRILKPNGCIKLGVPSGYNDSRGLIRYYNRFNRGGSHASGHIFFFQQPTFQFLFDKIGFKVQHAETLGFKNGLRNIGLLPQRKSWQAFYRPREKEEVAIESEIKLVTEKKYPELYYDYHYLKHGWFTLPGLHDFGLNFNFLLTR